MRKIFVFLFTFSFLFSGYSQEWKTLLPQKKDGELTLNDFKKAFNEYWKPFNVKDGYYIDRTTGIKQKAAGWKLFKRWEYYWESRVDPQTGTFPKTSAIDEYKKWKQKNRNIESRSVSGNWLSLGPDNATGGYYGIGRLNCVSFHPTDNNTYWVGSPSGGLWKTSDDGSNWTVLTDQNEVLGVSDIAVSANYASDNTLYLATGDRDGGSMWSLGGGQYNDNNSIGVLKSTDGGSTWNTTGLSFTVSQKRTISRLLIDPSDNNTLYASTTDGLYKTTDAGVSWTKINNSSFIDMEFRPGNSTTIYTSNKYGDIFRSTDSGSSFNSVLNTSGTRVQLAVSDDDNSVVYAVINSGSGLKGIYKSTNSGASFSSVFSSTNLLGYDCDGGDSNTQGNYDLCIASDPTNSNVIFVGGINTWKSTDGGSSWSINTHWSGTCSGDAETVHADKHFMAFQNGSSTLFQCNDGGIYKTTDSGDNWTDKTNGIVISQMYRLGVSKTESSATITGLQDNGTKLLHTDGAWHDVYGGDGMECLIDYTDYNTQYRCYVRGDIHRTTNIWSNTNITKDGNGNWINGIAANEVGNWVTPYVIDPNDHNTLYIGLEDLWKSTNKGDNWSKISSISSTDAMNSIAVAPSNSNYIYMSDEDQLWVTTNGGGSWTERTSGLPVASNSITYLAVKNNDPNTIWVTFGGYDGNRIYQSTDAGQNWTNISSGLPDLPTMCVVYNKQNTTETELYVGTDVGIYFKVGSADWQEFNSGLPNVVVAELEIYYDDATPENSRLRAATYGRGLWESDLRTAPTGPMTYVSSNTTQNNTDAVAVGSTDEEIIGIEIVVDGNESPLSVTSFNLSTNGSTDAADISTAKIYYTQNSSSYVASNQYGVLSNPDGSFTISGTQTLSPGTNYFWLAYDIDANATCDNILDAECLSIVLDGTSQTPTTTAPVGSRTITCEFCESYGSTQYSTSTTRVLFNTIDNNTGKDAAYTDYTNISTDVALIETYDLTVQVNTDGSYTTYTKVWIDWNRNFEFEASEEYDLGTAYSVNDGPTTASPLSITVPSDAKLGTVRMRVSTKFGSNPTMCETGFDGEVEDYSLNIQPGTLIWNGTNTQWNDPVNWTNGVVPNFSYKVIIPTNPVNGNIFPIIEAGLNAECYGLEIQSDATVTINGRLETKE